MLRIARWSRAGRSRVATTTLTSGRGGSPTPDGRARGRPRQVPPEHVLELAVVLGKGLLETAAGDRRQVGRGMVIVACLSSERSRWQTKKRPHIVHDPVRVLVELFARDDVELLARETPEPAGEHVEVTALRNVGVVLVRHAAIAGLAHDALRLAAQPARLGIQRVVETQPLAVVPDSFLVMGVRAFDRVAQQDDEPHAGELAGQTLRGEWMEQIVRARFTSNRGHRSWPGQVTATHRDREMRAVPSRAALVVRVEVVDTLDALAPGKQR